MKSAIPVLLALLLVCSLPAITIVAASPERGVAGGSDEQYALQESADEQTTPVEIENTTNQLPLTGDIRGSYAETGTDLGATLASSNSQMQIDHEQYVLAEREFDQADGEEQAAMIENAYNQTKERLDTLEERERDAVRAHASGDMSDGELIQVLLQNYHEATALEDTLNELDVQSDLATVSGDPLTEQQLRADRKIIDFHTTTVRTNLDAASKMGISDTQYEFRIQTSGDGYRLSTLDGDTYVTETVRFDNRDADAPNQYQSLDEVMDDARILYPWADANGLPHYQDNSLENLYWFNIAHNEGELDAYLDGGSGEIYREAQEVSVDSLPTVETETKGFANFEVILNKTPANGPVELTAIDPDTGEPVEETFEVNGTEIGETDEDGTLRYLPPGETDRYSLTANGTTRNVYPTQFG